MSNNRIFGVNFNGTQIPDGWKRKFAERIRVSKCGHARFTAMPEPIRCPKCSQLLEKGDMYRLVGVATDAEAKDAMMIQATNGHRRLLAVPRVNPGGIAFGIYTDS